MSFFCRVYQRNLQGPVRWNKADYVKEPSFKLRFPFCRVKQPNDFFSKPKCDMCQAHLDGAVCVECQLSGAEHLTREA